LAPFAGWIRTSFPPYNIPPPRFFFPQFTVLRFYCLTHRLELLKLILAQMLLLLLLLLMVMVLLLQSW
jgi:hypothetical protein